MCSESANSANLAGEERWRPLLNENTSYHGINGPISYVNGSGKIIVDPHPDSD